MQRTALVMFFFTLFVPTITLGHGEEPPTKKQKVPGQQEALTNRALSLYLTFAPSQAARDRIQGALDQLAALKEKNGIRITNTNLYADVVRTVAGHLFLKPTASGKALRAALEFLFTHHPTTSEEAETTLQKANAYLAGSFERTVNAYNRGDEYHYRALQFSWTEDDLHALVAANAEVHGIAHEATS